MAKIIAARLKKYLDQYKISPHMISHARTVTLLEAQQLCHINPNHFARSVLLKDGRDQYLVILPLSRQLDFSKIQRKLKRNVSIAKRSDVDRIFYDCEPGSHPPLGEPYGLRMLIDNTLLKGPFIYLEPGTHTAVLRLTKHDFQFLNTGAQWGDISIASDPKELQNSREMMDELVMIHNPGLDQVCQRIGSTYPLPPLPPIAYQLIAYIKNPISQENLAKYLNEDSNLKKSIVEYVSASLSFSSIETLEEAMEHLGSKYTMYLGIAIVSGGGFQVQRGGPLGLDKFWKHTLLAANLCKNITLQSSRSDIQPEMAYLCALMHNFGFLLFGHLFQPEFCLLNKMRAMYPKVPIETIEKKIIGLGQAARLIGYGHASMGSWLLKHWGMPDEVVVSAAYHHDSHYTGPHEYYVHLLRAVNNHLAQQGIGDECIDIALQNINLVEMGLSKNVMQEEFGKVQARDAQIPLMASHSD